MCGPISSSELAVCTLHRHEETTTGTLQLYLYYVSGYLWRRAPCVHRHEEKAAYMAIEMLELRLNEISPNDTVYKLFEYKELVSYCVTP